MGSATFLQHLQGFGQLVEQEPGLRLGEDALVFYFVEEGQSDDVEVHPDLPAGRAHFGAGTVDDVAGVDQAEGLAVDGAVGLEELGILGVGVEEEGLADDCLELVVLVEEQLVLSEEGVGPSVLGLEAMVVLCQPVAGVLVAHRGYYLLQYQLGSKE